MNKINCACFGSYYSAASTDTSRCLIHKRKANKKILEAHAERVIFSILSGSDKLWNINPYPIYSSYQKKLKEKKENEKNHVE